MGERRRAMEDLVIDAAFWRRRRVFVTGHTGFKGAWLALMLARLNAETTGYALNPPTDPSLFDLLAVCDTLEDRRGDVNDLENLRRAMVAADPEIVIHMAAQPLVRAGYAEPVATFQTNVMGVVNVLEAARACKSLKAVVNVTTDKCYDNREAPWGYRETDRLGGRDPYSASKACAELVTASYRASFFDHGATLATARAGNVIGGGDFAADRIVPDAVRAFTAGRALEVRAPKAVRPWQHVLEPLSGYLMLAEQAARQGEAFADGWNFGPGAESEQDVETLLTRFMAAWGPEARWLPDRSAHPHEAGVLRLDASKAREKLGWTPLLSFDETVEWTARWYRAHAAGADLRALTFDQLDAYLGQRVRLTSPFSKQDRGAAGEERDAAQRLA
ncbi:CDP-glucose 4,6-dehydratase [Rhodoblastus acidophilus]|uniref:CDP-glucose 4,6-dehydratase n=1 Tax=Rhodoblastus acidophilus TaxID=1074 RepID=UPI0022255F9C|nr:CDP-glucose 4,6-dehydratase [Rhodoblastus acidophilus]MCW2314979.1 CDP-glucose 4,6-dehydratase [Rhodoblastus acidophilus]